MKKNGSDVRIIIVDDHAVVRQGLKKILSEQPDMEIVAEFNNAADLIYSLDSKKYDVVIMDISLPGKSGFDAFKELHRSHPRLPVLFLSMLPEEQFAIRVLKAGAAGYLAKDSAPEELVKAIRKIHAGRKYISPSLAEKLATGIGVEIEKLPHEKLSEREFDVLRKIAAGETVTQIADELHISIKTVTTYRARVLAKMNMKTNADLTRYALEYKLIE